jgi:hypothetical protein
VYPGLTSSEASSWQGFFKLARDVHASYTPSQIDVNGDQAQVVVDGSLVYYNTDQHRQETLEGGFRARLERQGDHWIITQVIQTR